MNMNNRKQKGARFSSNAIYDVLDETQNRHTVNFKHFSSLFCVIEH